jgi:branched-chain amino acid transport system substrate-binding protein
VAVFLPGADGLKFADQYRNYVGGSKQVVLDIGANMAAGQNLAQLKEKAVGFIGSGYYTTAADNPVNQAFLKAFREKYPGRIVSPDAAQGYSAAIIVEAALKKVGGKIEDTQAFLQSLYSTNIMTAKGPIKLDPNHDVIENGYVFEIVRNGAEYQQKLLDTIPEIGQYGSLGEAKAAKLGTLKGKWVGMTKETLPAALGN